LESLSTLSPRELLARYRRLCEIAGEARESGRPLAFSDRADLYLVERTILLCLEGRSGEPHEAAADARPLAESLSEAAPRTVGQSAPVSAPAPDRQASLFGPADDAASAMPEQARSTSASTPLTPSRSLFSRGEGGEGVRSGPVVVYADGACQGNPGPGGYGVIVRASGRPDVEMSGGAPNTTNNQMELTGAIVGLRQAIQDGASEITIYSDSEYLVKGMNSWLAGWERKNWKTSTGQPVKNRELWETLSQLARGRKVTWNWVRGHAGHAENERCDELAVAAARQASLQRRNGR
jgi:ribonuclease HI